MSPAIFFNPAESIDFNGNTGPFIQYTYARIKSIYRKAEQQGVLKDTEEIIDEYEQGVEKLKEQKPKSPFLLLNSTLNKQRRPSNIGCRLPRVNITNDHFDITKIY